MIVEGIPFEIIEWLITRQRRCVECWADTCLETHHRVFRSTKNSALEMFLREQQLIYERTRHKPMNLWKIHDKQNLVRLCSGCHWRIHNGDRTLKEKYRNSFTCPETGFNVRFERVRSLY